jgi:hypothetical protein
MNTSDNDWAVLHVRVPSSHKRRMEAVVVARGDEYGAQATFMRRAMETQLLIEEHINGITNEPPPLRALLTLRAAIATGLDISDERCERVEIQGHDEALAEAEKCNKEATESTA